MPGSSRQPNFPHLIEHEVGELRKDMDRLLDPEHGIYPRIAGVESRLQKWAIAILSGILVDLITQVVFR